MRNLILLILLIISAFQVNAQNAFYKLYSNNGYDFGEGVAQLEDSSFIVTGTSSSFTDGPSQAFLLKVDSVGEYQWSLPYGGTEEDGARRVLYSPGDGFYVSGYTNSIGNGGYDVYVFKTDLSGSLIWEKSYGGSGWEKTNDAILLSDSSQIIVGQTNSNTNGDEDIYILRINKDGDSLFTKQIGGEGDDIANTVDLLNDSTVIIGGSFFNSDSLSSKGYLTGMHIDGTVLWSKEYGNDGNYWFKDLTVIDSMVHVVGKYYNDTVSNYEGYSGIMDFDGVLNTEFVFYKEGYDSHELITKYGDLDKFYIGYNGENSGTYPGGLDFFIIRAKANLLYDNSGCNFANVGEEVGSQLIPTNDGGAILVGTNEFYGAGGNNVSLLKIGRNDSYPITSGYVVADSLVLVDEVLSSGFGVLVYPNPTNGKGITVESSLLKINTISAYGLDGILFYEEKDLNNQHLKKINLSNLEKGNYILVLELEQNVTVHHKLIITGN